MDFPPHIVFAVLWIAWIVSWTAAAFWSSRAEKRALSWQTAVYRTAIVAGAVLLTPRAAGRLAVAPLWDVGYDGAYALAALTLAGLLHPTAPAVRREAEEDWQHRRASNRPSTLAWARGSR